jgi:recombinase
VLRTLHNPRYAGAFVYGQRREVRNPATGKKTVTSLPWEQWFAFFPDAHPGYISFEQFEANQAVRLGNAAAPGRERNNGPAREGTALLQGLAICGNCGRRMSACYHTRRGIEVPDYQCMRACIDTAASRCLLVPGAGVDAAIGQLLLDTLTPLALEVALTVQTDRDPRQRSRCAAPAQRRTRPAPRRLGPAAATSPSIPATGWSPKAWKPAGTTRCVRCKPPKTTTGRPPRPRPPRSPNITRPASRRSPATSPRCGQIRPPRLGNASACSGCSSTTSP